MTIPATSRVSPIYQGNASATVFAFSYKTYDKRELQVIVSDGVTPQTLVLDSDYSVALNLDQVNTPGGSITYPLIGSPLPVGFSLVVVSAVPNQQDVSLPTGGAFNAASVEQGLDRLQVQIQQFSDTLGRTLRVPVGESVAAPLPPALTRANYLLGFDGLGNPVAVAAAAGSAASLATDLTSTAVATKGAGQVGFQYALAYPAGTVGKWLKDLALPAGSTFIGYGGSTVKAALDSQAASILALQNIDIDALQEFVTNLAGGTAGTVACFGDSTMWGADPANLANQVAIPPPQQLQNLVNNYHGNTALTVTNNAISGTTCTQMIAGTDGSGSTFSAKMAASGAGIVYCNHGVNDAFGVNATTPAAYRTALLAFVKAVRAVNKTPVLVTPHPCLTIGTFGSQARAEATARFAQIMRDVSREHGVQLVDTNYVLSARMNIDGILPLAVLADGVHAPQAVYGVTGNQLSVALLATQTETFVTPGQRLPASSSAVKATGQSISPSTSSRVGVVTTTGTVSPQTLRIVFQVATPGLDLVLSHPVFSNGAGAVDVSLDGVSQGSLSMLSGGFVSPFWQDFETVIARNVPVGMHILILTTSSTGGAGIFALRSRLAEKPLLLPSGSAVPRQTVLLSPKIELSSSVATTMTVFDTMPMSRFIDALDFEWTAQMPINSAVIIGGNIGTNGGAAACERAVSIGLNASGFVQVDEATAPGTYSSTVLNAANLSGASHLFRVLITTAGVVTVIVDGTALGSTATLAGPFKGGLLGLYKSAGAGTILTLSNVSRSWGL